jgi:hypothetical protein
LISQQPSSRSTVSIKILLDAIVYLRENQYNVSKNMQHINKANPPVLWYFKVLFIHQFLSPQYGYQHSKCLKISGQFPLILLITLKWSFECLISVGDSFAASLCNSTDALECAGGESCLGVTLLTEREHNRNNLLNMLAMKVLPNVKRGC